MRLPGTPRQSLNGAPSEGTTESSGCVYGRDLVREGRIDSIPKAKQATHCPAHSIASPAPQIPHRRPATVQPTQRTGSGRIEEGSQQAKKNKGARPSQRETRLQGRRQRRRREGGGGGGGGARERSSLTVSLATHKQSGSQPPPRVVEVETGVGRTRTRGEQKPNQLWQSTALPAAGPDTNSGAPPSLRPRRPETA